MRVSKRLIALLCAAALIMSLSACGGGHEGEGEGEGESEGDNSSNEPIVKLFKYDPGESFRINLAGDGDTLSVLMCKVVFEVSDEEALRVLDKSDFKIRAAVNKELGKLTEADVTINKDLDGLSARLVKAVNEELDLTIFEKAYITEFIAQ